MVLLLLEGGDRLDIVRIIITDVGSGQTSVGRGEMGGYTSKGVVMTTPTNISIKPTSIALPPWPSPLCCYLHYTTRR